MQIRTSVAAKFFVAALVAIVSITGCSSGSDDGTSPGGSDETLLGGYTVSSETTNKVTDGVNQLKYVLTKTDSTMTSGTKANNLYVLDVDPSKNTNLEVSLGMPNGMVRGLGTASEFATYLDSNSTASVVGGVNGDFFDTVSGGPAGYSMHDGRWLSTGEYSTLDTTSTNHTYPGWAFGIKSDGSAIIAQPSIALTFDSFTGTTQDSDNVVINALNQLRSDATSTTSQPALVLAARADNYIVLYTPDYYTSTSTADGGVEVTFTTSDTVKSNGTVTGTVTAVSSSTGNSTLASGTMILSGYGTGATALSAIEVGDTITIAVTVGSEWADVVECLGGGRHDGGPLLVQNGAVYAEDTTIVDYTSFYGNNPRTAVGVRADGTYFFYVVDGRNTGVSDGATIAELSQFAVDLGATIAVNLDGGRSSTMITGTGTKGTYNLVNQPCYAKTLDVEREDGNGFFILEK